MAGAETVISGDQFRTVGERTACLAQCTLRDPVPGRTTKTRVYGARPKVGHGILYQKGVYRRKHTFAASVSRRGPPGTGPANGHPLEEPIVLPPRNRRGGKGETHIRCLLGRPALDGRLERAVSAISEGAPDLHCGLLGAIAVARRAPRVWLGGGIERSNSVSAGRHHP